MSESEDPRDRLAKLAEAGRVQREAETAAQTRAEQQEADEEARAAARHARLMSYTTWASLSAWMRILYYLPFVLLGTYFIYSVNVIGARWFYGILTLCGALLGITFVAVLLARRSDIAFRAALPFPVEGYTSVLGRPARAVCCMIEFAGPLPEVPMFEDLLRPLHHPTKLLGIEKNVFKVDASAKTYSLLDDHCRWMPRWFRAFNKSVLKPIHAVYPIRSIRLR